MDKRRLEIIEKSCRLFAKFGIKSISMDDIARECGISKKTLYEIVTDKKDLVTQVIEQEFKTNGPGPHNIDIENVNAVEALFLVYKGAVEFFKEYNLSMEFDLQKYYPDLHTQTKSKRRKHLYEKISQNMILGRKEKFYRNDFNIDIATKFHIIKIEAMLNTNIFDENNYSPVEIFKEMFLYHFNAIATQKGKVALEAKMKELGVD